MTHGLALAVVVMLSCSTTCFGGCSCSPATPPPDDAGLRTDARRDDASVVRPDTGLDAGGGTQPPLAPCTDTSECAAAPGVSCLTNVPGGSCTRRCATDGDCGARGTCVLNICLWGCTSGSGDCVEHAGACFQTMGTSSYCVPICYPAGREPRGYPSCGAGLVCDPYSSTCTTSPATGAENGAPCRDGIECRGGDCLVENNPTPTGFLDGMCISYGVEPSPSDYVPGAPLPQGSCPDGSAVIPGLASGFYGDLAICFRTCVSDGECRPGYGCTHFEVSSPPNTDGLCIPIDCASAPCPAGTTCADVSSWLGHQVCTRTP